MVNRKEIEEFFLEAAAKTYAADAPKTTIAELPKSKVLRYERGEWLYVDCYFSANGKSFGQTTIWFQGQPVWGMQYSGFWDKDDKRVIPFLKRALAAAYAKGEFYGGRGPHHFQDEDGSLIYTNQPDDDDFGCFDGWEEISDSQNVLFTHYYNGITLI